MDQFFAVSAPGAAPYTAQELRQLGLLPPAAAGRRTERRATPDGGERDQQGGVAFAGDRTALYRANLHLRTANRVLMRLGDFPAVGFAELRKRAARLPWERCLAPGQPVALRVTCHKSRLYHSDAVAERVAGAIADHLGRPTSVCKFDEEEAGTPPQLIVVRLVHDHCTISVDSSGELLHRRGYRLATAKAPLRETLAATMLLAAGWTAGWTAGWAAGQDVDAAEGPAALLDPFCGSGTVAIEAAQMALGVAPGLASGQARHFAFSTWPDFDAGLWGQLLEQAQEKHAQQLARQAGRLQIGASDRDAGAIEQARANATRGGVAEHVVFGRQPVSAVTPCCESGWIVTNPPYGLRVSAGHDVRNLYAQFGHVLRSSFDGWQLALLCNDRQLLAQLGLPLDLSLNLVNGGLPVVLARGRV